MARPIQGIPAFRGKAAKWLTEYLSREITLEEREQKRKRREEDARIVKLYFREYQERAPRAEAHQRKKNEGIR